MDSDEERHLTSAQTKHYAALRSDISAALAAFDRAQDWADLIHDLQRVNRVLSKHPSTTYLPEKTLLAKRLAQCLTSFLPSGVHLKALETYHIVFRRIGSQRLARDLPLYAGGLFPLFSHCSTSLKAPLLSLYETHFLPLGTALCPVLDGLVLAILPGVEDESSEFYTRSFKLLDDVGQAVEDVGIFARSLWRALLLSPPMRLSAAHYLRSKLSAGHDDLRAEMVRDMPLVAYAITAALSDNNALTQRSVLDLLLGELALDSPFFQCSGEEERDAAVAVVSGVFGTLIRRDMSLTKRVHAWLLGGKESNDGIAFCIKYSNELVLAAMDREFASLLDLISGKNAAFAARPCRITAALMSRPELSSCLGQQFALRVLKYGHAVILKIDSEHEGDMRHAIADLLQDLGSDKVFAELERMLAGEDQKNHEDFELLTFALSLFPTKNDVVRTQHLPALLRVAVLSLNAVTTDSVTLERAVAFCSKAIQSMGLNESGVLHPSVIGNVSAAVSSFASFFVAWLAHVVEMAPVEVRRAYNDVSVAEEYAAEIRMAAVHESREECTSLAKGACSFFIAAAASGVGGPQMLRSTLQATAKCASAADVRISLFGAKAFAEISVHSPSLLDARGDENEQILGIVRRSWRQMHPSLRTATPQSAQAFLTLQARFPEQAKVVIADGILASDSSRRLRNLERFACLWRLAVEHHLRPLPSDDGLFLMLDALTDEDWAPKMLAQSWLSYAVEVDAASVLDAPLRLLLTPEAKAQGPRHEFVATYDAPRALYGFQVLRGILESCTSIVSSNREQGYGLHAPSQLSRRDGKRGRTGIRALASASVSPKTTQALSEVFGTNASDDSAGETSTGDALYAEGPVRLSHLLPVHNYVITVALTCLGYLRGQVPSRYSNMSNGSVGEHASQEHKEDVETNGLAVRDEDDYEWLSAGLGFRPLSELHAGVCAASAECLATLFRAVPVPSQMSAALAHTLAEPILNLLTFFSDGTDPVLQLHFLNSVAFLVTADGPCYLSSVQGKDAFTRAEASRLRLSYSESQNQLPSVKSNDQSEGTIQVGSAERLKAFVPWLLDGVASSCRSQPSDKDNGSHEVLGIRRRWVQFIETVIRHVGVSLPIVTEGLIGILSELLQLKLLSGNVDLLGSDNDYSRGDETLVLLEALAVVGSNVLWSFEYALAKGELKDDSKSNLQSSFDFTPSRFVGPVSGQAASANGGEQTGAPVPSEESNGEPGSDLNGRISGTQQQEKQNNVSAATSAMMNAINPLRMINDFVKDVLGGGGSDGLHRLLDPRRSAARLLFYYLPDLLKNMSQVWGHVGEAQSAGANAERRRSSRSRENGPPRLSMELPRERREAQRMAALSILEPLFELRPRDVIASVVAMFCGEQGDHGEIEAEISGSTTLETACNILHSMEESTPELIISAVKIIFDTAVKWDQSSADAKEGRSHASFRQKALTSLRTLITSDPDSANAADLRSVGRMPKAENAVSLPGGTSGVDLSHGFFTGVGSFSSSHEELFHWGDFFATYASEKVETSCLNFLDVYFRTLPESSNLQSAFPALHGLLKEALASSKKKETTTAILRVLGTYVSRNQSPFPDRRYRRDIMTLAASVMSSCSSIASSSIDVSAASGSSNDLKPTLPVVALRALAATVPALVDSSFLEDKQQLSSSVTACLAPAVSALKKSAARASSQRAVSENSKRARTSTREQTERQKKEDQLHAMAATAAADVLHNISNRDWGIKFVRRELLTLIEDSNFFYAKDGGVLEKISAVIREVVAGGGAATLLTSIGSSSSAGAPGIPSIFTGRDSEALQRCRAIRRIAFCVFVAEPDFYSPQLPSVLERLRDALRMADPGLVVECLMCLRALLLRIGPSSVSAFRATTLSELFRILSYPQEDLNATVAALKFLDVVTLLSPADYGYERCFFFGETLSGTEGTKNVPRMFEPLVPKLTTLWSASKRSASSVFTSPLRLEEGRTVLPGKAPNSFDQEFVGRYAAALVTRNSMPKMKAAKVDTETISREFELEFLT